jgi:hypothetical protein
LPCPFVYPIFGREERIKKSFVVLLGGTATKSIVSFVSLYEQVIPPEKVSRRTPFLTFQKGSSYAKIP